MAHDHSTAATTVSVATSDGTSSSTSVTMMTMFFHTGLGDTLFFSSWTPRSNTAYAFTILALVVLGILARGLVALLAVWERSVAVRNVRAATLVYASFPTLLASSGGDGTARSWIQEGPNARDRVVAVHGQKNGAAVSETLLYHDHRAQAQAQTQIQAQAQDAISIHSIPSSSASTASNGTQGRHQISLTETASARQHETRHEHGDGHRDIRERDTEHGRAVHPWRLSTDVPRGIMTGVSAGLGYLLMLAVMTGNVGYFFGVLLGITLGEVAFGRFAFPAVVVRDVRPASLSSSSSSQSVGVERSGVVESKS